MNSKISIKNGYNVFVKNNNEIEIRSGAWSSPVITIVDDKKLGKLEDIVSKFNGNYNTNEIIQLIGIEYKDIIRSLIYELSQRGILDTFNIAISPIRSYFSIYSNSLDLICNSLKNATIFVVGSGLLGSKISTNLSFFGIKKLILLDNSRIENIHTSYSPYFSKKDIDKFLGSHVSNMIKQINEKIEIEYINYDMHNDLNNVDKLMSSSQLTVVCPDYPVPKIWSKVNNMAIENNFIWTIATIDGYDGQIGPTFIPFETACYKCLELRINNNITNHQYNMRYKQIMLNESKSIQQNHLGIPGIVDIVTGFLTLDVPNIITTKTGYTIGKLILINYRSPEFETHSLLKLPRCSECGKTYRGWSTNAFYTSLNSILDDRNTSIKNE
ncbi:MAG: TOMM precursor leader peptide-binding protein [Nitrososphaeraceae archaeon]